MSYSILLQVINKSAIIFYQKNMSNQEGQLICYFKQAQKNFSVRKKNFLVESIRNFRMKNSFIEGSGESQVGRAKRIYFSLP